MADDAIPALSAGYVMGRKDPVARAKIFDLFSCLYDFSRNFVTQNQWGLLDAVPFHQIAAANPAGADPQQQFAARDLRNRHLFQADVPVVVIHRDPHALTTVSSLRSRVQGWV